jgi:16S rRNA processing protein RimM
VTKAWVSLGRVLRPHGVKGGLHVKLDNPLGQSLRAGIPIQLKGKDGRFKDFEVASFIAGRILTLKELDDRDIAEKLGGSEIFLDRSDFPAIREDEIYLRDMLGFEVFDVHGTLLGTVFGFSDNTAQVILDVRSEAGSHGLIPFVKPLIQKIDQAARAITVDIPEGLFESKESDA